MVLLLTLQAALGCAMVVHGSGDVAESPGQQVILSGDGANTVVKYRVQLEGDAESFGWVVPLSGGFVSLEDGDSGRFDALWEATPPLAEWEGGDVPYEGSCGCRGAGKGGELDANFVGRDTVLDVVAEGFTGTYEYTVVTGEGDLDTWVANNGWTVDDSVDSAVAPYLDAGDEILLVRLERDVQPSGLGELPPLVVTTSGGDLRYPARMARFVDRETQRTTLFVVGDQTATLSGWPVDDDTYLDAFDYINVTDAWYGNLTERGGSYVHTWSGEIGGEWVTRFDTLTRVEDHTADVVASLDGGQYHHQLVLMFSSEPTGLAWMLLPGLGWLLRRRKDYSAVTPSSVSTR